MLNPPFGRFVDVIQKPLGGFLERRFRDFCKSLSGDPMEVVLAIIENPHS